MIKNKLGQFTSAGITLYNKTRVLSTETRRKMSRSAKIRGYNGKGYHSAKTRKIIRRKMLQRLQNGWKPTGTSRFGKLNPNWKGGKSQYECSQNWAHKHPKQMRLLRRARYHRERAAGKMDSNTLQRVYEDNIKKFGTLTCYLCLQPIPFGKDTLEHKIPIVKGGTNIYDNLAIAHRSCNSKKHSKTYTEYVKAMKEAQGA